MEINIPFQGFYGSLYSDLLDREGDYYLEARPEHADALWQHTNYHKGYIILAQGYVEVFNEYFRDEFEIALGLKFKELVSPKWYNFETDRIFCEIPEEAVKTLRDKVSLPALRNTIRERHTSRSGFISFYDNELESWPDDVTGWDANQLCTLLLAFLSEEPGWEDDVFDAVAESGVASQAWDEAVDWQAPDLCPTAIRAKFPKAAAKLDRAAAEAQADPSEALQELLLAQAAQADAAQVRTEIAQLEQAAQARVDAAALQSRVAAARRAMAQGASLADLRSIMETHNA